MIDQTKGMLPEDRRHHELKQELHFIYMQLKRIADHLEQEAAKRGQQQR